MRKVRKHYTAEEKVAILRRHLVDKEPVSKLCRLQPWRGLGETRHRPAWRLITQRYVVLEAV